DRSAHPLPAQRPAHRLATRSRSARRDAPEIAVEKRLARVEGRHADALVAPVRALVVTVDGNSGDSVGRQAGGAGVDPVRGACMHVGYDLEARPPRGDRILQSLVATQVVCRMPATVGICMSRSRAWPSGGSVRMPR